MSGKKHAGLTIACIAGLFAIAVSTTSTQAQTWPQRTVKLLLPLGPGSGVDIGARLIAPHLQVRWGQPVVVENRPGGDGVVAISAFTTAADDHLLLLTPVSSFIAHPYEHAKLPYDRDRLAPIARVTSTVSTFAVPATLNAATLGDFTRLAKSEAGRLNWASTTSLNDMVFRSYLVTNGLTLGRVAYRDQVQSMADISEGRVHAYFGAYAVTRPFAEAGKVKLLAVSNHSRPAALPDVQTVREAGHPELELDGLVGLFGPPTMSIALRKEIARDVIAATLLGEVSQKLVATGQIVVPGDPAEFQVSIDQQRTTADRAAKTLSLNRAN